MGLCHFLKKSTKKSFRSAAEASAGVSVKLDFSLLSKRNSLKKWLQLWLDFSAFAHSGEISP